jgi:hypothetical protein
MEQLVNKFENQYISQSVDIDSICNQLINSGIDYDERSELFDFLSLKMAGKSELVKTDERYARYLRGIDIWEIDGVSYEYIRENIKHFLSMETNDNNLIKKLKLMRKIDKQIKEVIETIDD